MVWTCFDCRLLYPTVKCLDAEIKEMKDNQTMMLKLMKQINEQLQTEIKLREKTENELVSVRSQLNELNQQLDKQQLCTNAHQQATPSAPPLEIPSAPPLPNLLLGTSLLRNVDPKKLTNWEIKVKGGATIDDLHKEISTLPEEKAYDKITIVCGSIDLESKDDPEIVLDYQALVASASLRGNCITISSILPRSDKDLQTKRKEVNTKLSEMCDKDGHSFIDNDPFFYLWNGDVNGANLTTDGLHLTKRGIDSLLKNLGIIQSGSAFTPTKYPKAENSGTLLFKGHAHPLSNFFEVKITQNGREFPTLEAAYQYSKAEAMGDSYRGNKILNAETGLHAMRIASHIKTDENWQENKIKVMEHLIKEKLRVCEPARSTILSSGSKEIIEDTTHEFWGRGKQGKGQNQLGKIWMKFRQRLRKDPNFVRKDPISHQKNRSFPGRQIEVLPRRRTWATRQQQPRCYQCGETGHLIKQCGLQQTVHCWACGLQGHKSKHCDYSSSRSWNFSSKSWDRPSQSWDRPSQSWDHPQESWSHSSLSRDHSSGGWDHWTGY